MSYVVLARKWRPKQFEQVVGQGHVARTLKNSIAQNRVAHAYLFTGARGVGKTSTARILAKALNCEQGPTDTPCYQCNSCTEILRGQSVDVFEIDGASNRGINEIRELREGVRYAPSRDRYKVYIIDEVHMLTTEAFNALLKTLEEPPAHAIFIFATTEPQKIPVTILSRCQRFDFKRVGQRDIVDHLEFLCKEEGVEAERAALQLIARQAAGGMRDAMSLLDQIISFAGYTITEAQIAEILGVANRRHLFDLSEAILGRNAGQALGVLEEVNSFGYDLQHFAGELVNHLRDLMVVAVVEHPESVTDLTSSELELARQQLQTHEISAALIHRYFSLMVQGVQEMHRSPFPKLLFEMSLVRMAQLEPLIGLDLIVDKLRVLEKELEDVADITPSGQPPVVPPPVVPPERIEKKKTDLVGARFEELSNPAESSAESSPAPITSEHTEVRASLPDMSSSSIEASPNPLKHSSPAPTEATVPPSPARDIEATVEEPAEHEELSHPIRIENAEELTVAQRWLAVAEYLREANLPVAVAFENAYAERFDDGLVHLSFEDKFLEFAQQPDRVDLVKRAINGLFGDEYQLTISLRDESQEDENTTIAQDRRQEREARRQQLEEEMRCHPAVQKAQDLFASSEVNIKVSLNED